MGDVVQIDDCAEVAGDAEFFVGGFVGGEHDALAGDADGFAEAQFGEGGAIRAEAFRGEDAQEEGVGGGFDSEEFAEAG